MLLGTVATKAMGVGSPGMLKHQDLSTSPHSKTILILKDVALTLHTA